MTPFFIVGPPKTGTTVLTRLVVQHPEITCISESYVLDWKKAGSIANPGGEKWAQHGFSREDAARWHTIFDGMGSAKGLRQVLSEAWRSMMRKTDTRVAGDSWPFYSQHLPTIAEAFPNARFIYTTRDPRAVFWSGQTFMDRKQGSWNSALLLSMDRSAREFFERRNVFVVRYEELIAKPRQVMDALWRYLDVDPEKGWIEYDKSKDPFPQRWSWIPNATKPLDPSRTSRWEVEMPAPVRRYVDLAAAEYASVWDYPLELDTTYQQQEFVEAFLAGASLQLLPPNVEDVVRATFATTRQSLQQVQPPG